MMGCFLLSFLLSFLPSVLHPFPFLSPSSLSVYFPSSLSFFLVLSSIPSVLPPLVFLSLCPFFYSFPPLFFSQTLNYSFPSLLPSLRPLPCIAFSSCPRPSLICVFSPFPSVFRFLPPSVPLHFPFLAHTLVCFFLFSRFFPPFFCFPPLIFSLFYIYFHPDSASLLIPELFLPSCFFVFHHMFILLQYLHRVHYPSSSSSCLFPSSLHPAAQTHYKPAGGYSRLPLPLHHPSIIPLLLLLLILPSAQTLPPPSPFLPPSSSSSTSFYGGASHLQRSLSLSLPLSRSPEPQEASP